MSPSHLADFALLPTPNSQVVGRREIEAAEVQGRRGGLSSQVTVRPVTHTPLRRVPRILFIDDMNKYIYI